MVKRAAAVNVAAKTWFGSGKSLEIVMAQVRRHVAQADDLGAEVAFGGACAIGEFVGCEAREDDFCG